MYHLPEISVHFWQKNLCWCCARRKLGKIKRNDHENHTLQRDTFLKTVFKVSARVRSLFSILLERDIIQCNCLFHLFKCSLGGSSLNFHEFLILPIRKISRNTKKEIHSWGELPMKWNCKYETCKTKNLQRWNVILTNENDAILWVTAITTVPEIKKHIKVGLQFVINEGIK